MHNLCAIFAKYLDICKHMADNLAMHEEIYPDVVSFLNFQTWKWLRQNLLTELNMH